MTNSSLNDRSTIGRKVTVGASWLIMMRWTMRLFGLVSTMVLARLLTPEDFGIVAIATSYIGIILGMTDLNISRAIIQFKDVERNVYDTAWTLGIIRGLILATIILLSAIPVANFIDEPKLVYVITALAFSAFLAGFENPRFVIFEKDLKYSKLFILEISTKIAAVVTTITCAFIFQNYWALIGGMLVSTAIRLLLSFLLRPALPRFCLQATNRILSFVVWLSGNTILTQLNTRLFNFVIGSVVGIAQTGKFHMSMELSELVNEFQGPLARVLYSAYSKINNSVERLTEVYISASSVIFLLVLPAGVGLSLISRDFIFIILGEQWLNIAPYFSLFCIMIGLTSISATSDAILVALGRQKLVFYRELSLTVVTFISLGVAIWYETLLGFVIARFVSGLLWAVLTQFFVQKSLKMRVGQRLFIRLWRVLVAVICMVVAVLFAQRYYNDTMEFSSSLIRILISVGTGAACYSGVLILLWNISGKPEGPEKWILTNIISKITRKLKFKFKLKSKSN